MSNGPNTKKKYIRYFLSFVAILLSFSFGFLLKQFLVYKEWKKVHKHPDWLKHINDAKKDNFHYLGTIGGKNVFGSSFFLEETGNAGKNYAIKMDDKLVYWETDSNLDGTVDEIKHFVLGKIVFVSRDADYDGMFEERHIDSFNEDGFPATTIVDRNADNRFDLKIIHEDPTKGNEYLENAVVEIHYNGEWIKRVTKGKRSGIEIDNIFYPIKFVDDDWVILEDETVADAR